MASSSPILKQTCVVAACLVAIAGAAAWIYRKELAAPKFNLALHQAVGHVMAMQTAQLLDSTGKVVVVTIDPDNFPELKAQLEEYGRVLRGYPQITLLKTKRLETDGKAKYSFGMGLSGRRFVRAVNNHPDADVVVSFVGAPTLTEEDLAQLKAAPKFLAEARSADKLKRLFDQHILQTAIVSRFQFPSPVKGTPYSAQEWFDQRFQVVTATNAAALPVGKEE